MALAAGSRFGPYEIAESIGSGGMGEVYRATDTKLGREVAIKTLPTALAEDAERLARFEREAKLLAALNHANIAVIYGLDQHEGTHFIAMELVRGQTLEKRLESGSLPVDEALQIAVQVAEALEAAHAKGVIHRDLKPANVMLTLDGVVKVLDFGLAKAFSDDPNNGDATQSPALSLAMTQAGLILGTAGYMSPEQASGQVTDQRADIWAFGVVLYEMLTGLPPFSGESVPHILADVLRAEPDWGRLPKDLHPRLKLLLARCLAKKPRRRFHSMADVRIEIEDVMSDPSGPVVPFDAIAAGDTRSQNSLAFPIAATVLVTLAVGGLLGLGAWRLWPEAPRPVTRFAVDLPGGMATFQPVALSPDGQRIVYAANGQLYSRRMDQAEAVPLPGTEGGGQPFFSPDGESVAFFAGFQLKAVGFGGVAPRVLATVQDRPGVVGVWDEQDRIVFGQAGPSPMSWVPAVGGTPQPFAALDDYADVDFPDDLPGGEWVLFSANRVQGDWSETDIVVQNIATGERRVVLEDGNYARYVDTGHLVYVRGGTLYAVAFDVNRMEVRGPTIPVVQDIASDDTSGFAKFSVASNGTLIYLPGNAASGREGFELVSADRSGSVTSLSAERRDYENPRVSPDGTRVAVEVQEGTLGDHIWVMDLESGSAAKLTFEGASNTFPVWTADGREVLFMSDRGGEFGIYRKSADGTGEAVQVLVADSPTLAPADVIAGNTLIYHRSTATGSRDVFALDLDSGGQPAPVLVAAADEFAARISPDGAWIVYVSDESGQPRVYARPYPDTDGGRRAVSDGPGAAPAWSQDGGEIFFIGRLSSTMMATPISYGENTMTPGRPEELFAYFENYRIPGSDDATPYDVLPDGSGFVAVRAFGLTSPQGGVTQLNVVLNWTEELRALISTK